MTPPPIISNQRALLQAIAKGGRAYPSRDERTGKQQWWLKPDNDSTHPHIRVLFSVAFAVQRKGYLERTYFRYWKLTDAGQAHLGYLNLRTSKGKKLPKEYTR